MFLPTTRKELDHLGWDQLDIVPVTGDSYIDSPFIGIAVIGKVPSHAGSVWIEDYRHDIPILNLVGSSL